MTKKEIELIYVGERYFVSFGLKGKKNNLVTDVNTRYTKKYWYRMKNMGM